MRSSPTGPRGLVLSLLLSAVAYTAIVILRFTSEPIFGTLLSTCFAANSAYYLARYVQRRIVLKRDILAGGDAWPTAPLFPGKDEGQFVMSAGFVLWCAVMFSGSLLPSKSFGLHITFTFNGSIVPDKTVAEIQPLENIASRALVAAYILALAVNIVVFIQARRIRKAEDNIICAVAHRMRCERCTGKQAELDQPQGPLFSDLHLRTIGTLRMSMVLSLVLCAALLALAPAEIDMLWILFAAAALTAVHRLFFLIHTKLARPVNWPSTRLFPGKFTRKVFNVGNIIAFQLSVIIVLYMFSDPRLAWSAGAAARSVLIAQLMVLAANFVTLVYNILLEGAEAQVVCKHEGHQWKCMRSCSVSQDAEASATGTDQKALVEEIKEVRRSMPFFAEAGADGCARTSWLSRPELTRSF